MNPETLEVREFPKGEVPDPWIEIPESELREVRAMSDDEKRGYLKRLANRRKRERKRRKANRKNRRQR